MTNFCSQSTYFLADTHFHTFIHHHNLMHVDIFLCPMLEIYSDMKHSYIVELKYAKYKDSETRAIPLYTTTILCNRVVPMPRFTVSVSA